MSTSIESIRSFMEDATRRAEEAAQAEASSALLFIARVAKTLVPTATHVVLGMGDAYESPIYNVRLLVDNDVQQHPDLDDHVVWSFDWQTPEALAVADLLRLVHIDRDNADPLLREALDDAEGDKVTRGAYLGGGDDPIVIPLAGLA